MFNTRNKSGISAHPRIILYLMNVEGKLFKKMLEEDCNLLTMSSYNAPKDAGTLELRICGISCQVYKKAAQFVKDIFRYQIKVPGQGYKLGFYFELNHRLS